MGKNKPQYPRCVDCGRHAGIVQCSDGRVCRQCQDDRNERLSGLADGGMVIVQPVDPDDRAYPCGNTGCTRDATTVVRFKAGAGFPADTRMVQMMACNDHIAAASGVAVQIREGNLSGIGRIEEAG